MGTWVPVVKCISFQILSENGNDKKKFKHFNVNFEVCHDIHVKNFMTIFIKIKKFHPVKNGSLTEIPDYEIARREENNIWFCYSETFCDCVLKIGFTVKKIHFKKYVHLISYILIKVIKLHSHQNYH